MEDKKLAPVRYAEAANDPKQCDCPASECDGLGCVTERFSTKVEIPADLVNRYYALPDWQSHNLGETICGLLEKYCAIGEGKNLG